MLSIEEIKQKLSPIFSNPDLMLVLLFGSVTSSKTHKESDMDLGFLFEKPVYIIKLTNDVIKLLKTDKVDVID